MELLSPNKIQPKPFTASLTLQNFAGMYGLAKNFHASSGLNLQLYKVKIRVQLTVIHDACVEKINKGWAVQEWSSYLCSSCDPSEH